MGNNQLVSCLEANKTIIYGAGNTGKDVYNILRKFSYQINGFIDNIRFGTKIEETIIYNAQEIKDNFSSFANDNVIIAIFNRDVDIAKIILELKNIGFQNIFTFVEFYQNFDDELKDRFWLSNAKVIIDEQDKIQLVYELLTDDKSKQLFDKIIKFRIKCDYSILDEPLGLDQQYFPPDINYWPKNANFIDVGAFDGDTIRLAHQKNIDLSSVICLEPDVNNYKKLVASNNDDKFNKISILNIPCGLWYARTILKFAASQGEGSRLLEDGKDIINVIALDDLISNITSPLTNIKMDIEGAELSALQGAKNTITKYKPNLAIGVYHKPKDLWEIPIYINKLNTNCAGISLRLCRRTQKVLTIP